MCKNDSTETYADSPASIRLLLMIAGSADRTEHAAACFAHQTGGGSVCWRMRTRSAECGVGRDGGDGGVGGGGSVAAAGTAVVTAAVGG